MLCVVGRIAPRRWEGRSSSAEGWPSSLVAAEVCSCWPWDLVRSAGWGLRRLDQRALSYQSQSLAFGVLLVLGPPPEGAVSDDTTGALLSGVGGGLSWLSGLLHLEPSRGLVSAVVVLSCGGISPLLW